MSNPSYMVLSRHNIYYFRYPLVRTHSKIDYIYISLRTREPKEALRLAKGLEYYASEISRSYRDILMQDHEIKKLVGEFLKERLKRQWLQIDQQPYYSDKEEQWSNALKTIEADPIPYTKSIIKKMELNIENDSEDFQVIHEYIHRNLPDYYTNLKEYNEQAFKVGLSPNEIKEVVAIYRLSDVITKFLEASKTERDWKEGRREEVISYLNILKEILGENFDTMTIDKEKARYVVDIIYKLPANKDKVCAQGLPIAEVVKVENLKKISAGTIKKYLGVYNLFFEWCENMGYSASNPIKNLKGNIAKKRPEVRYALPEASIGLIFRELNQYPNGLVKKEYQYWGTLIGLYTGARLNEIAQLEISDIRQIDGTWYFDINDDNNKMLKTKSSKRKIPMHNKLIEHGLLKYVEHLKEAGKTRLLHQLTWGNKGYGRKLGRFFNENLLPNLGIKEENVSFHCLRHTVNTRLLQNDVELFKIQSILGHTVTTGMTANYAQEGYKLSQLHEAIHKLPY